METCRICLENSQTSTLISPCKCTGSQKYVHKACLMKWQNIMIDNAYRYPEVYSLEKVITCNVCKSNYDSTYVLKSWGILSIFTRILKFFQRNLLIILILFLIPLLLSGILLIYVIANVVFIVTIASLFFLISGIRPRLVGTAEGISLRFIRVGRPVADLRAGIMLKATDVVSDGIFVNSTILITAYSASDGAVGFIINKRARIAYVGNNYNQFANVGGPVGGLVNIMHDCAELPGCTKIVEGLYLGGLANLLPAHALRKTFNGHCGWSSLQLDGEIRAGVWTVCREITPQDVLN